VASIVNYDMKLSTDKCCSIDNFISILDDVTELKDEIIYENGLTDHDINGVFHY
jgi:hypothetical protein